MADLSHRIKKYLDDIVDVAFKDEDEKNLKNFKNYTLKLSSDEKKTTAGRCYLGKRLIEVYNPSRGTKLVAKTCIHELAHHIDWCLHGCSGHQKPFYEIYTKLIYASLDMGVMTRDDYFSDRFSRERNKVKVIVANYVPHEVDYKMDHAQVISILNAFEQREKLKGYGYRWNAMEQTWDKEINRSFEEEEYILKMLGIERYDVDRYESGEQSCCYIVKAPDLYIDAMIYLEVKGDTYPVKDKLKEYGFLYNPQNKGWYAKVRSSELECTIEQIRSEEAFKNLHIGYMKRKPDGLTTKNRK